MRDRKLGVCMGIICSSADFLVHGVLGLQFRYQDLFGYIRHWASASVGLKCFLVFALGSLSDWYFGFQID